LHCAIAPVASVVSDLPDELRLLLVFPPLIVSVVAGAAVAMLGAAVPLGAAVLFDDVPDAPPFATPP
jgi:hypothetical protein